MDPLTQQQPTTQPQSSHWGIVLVFLFGFLMLFGGLAGGYFYELHVERPIVQPKALSGVSLTPSPTPYPTGVMTIEPAPSPKLIPPSGTHNGWNVYKNTTYHFSMEYPKDINAVEYFPDYVRFTSDNPNEPGLPNSQVYLSVIVKNNPNKVSLYDWIKKNWDDTAVSTVLNAQDAYHSIHYQVGSFGDTFFLEHDGYIYQISSVIMASNVLAPYESHVHSINTFTFTD